MTGDAAHPAKKTKISSSQDLPRPPNFTLPPSSSGSDLLSRLNAFLPELEAANAQLDPSRNMEEVDSDDEQYIEMNLGLGVLKQIRPGQTDVSSDEESSDDDADEDGNGENGDRADKEDTPMKDADVSMPLLRSSKRHGKGPRCEPLLEEVREAAATPTPLVADAHGGHGDEEGAKGMTLEGLLMASKRHGKGPRGRPVIEEVEETGHTPTPDKQVVEERRRHRSSAGGQQPGT